MLHRLFHGRIQDARSESIWLTVYADLITTLALIFLCLYGLTVMGDDALSRALVSMDFSRMESTDIAPRVGAFEEIMPVVQEAVVADPDISVLEEAGAVRIRLGERFLFGSGQAALMETVHPVLEQIAGALRASPFTIVVEGHTDDVPMRPGGLYHDNWELSLARAMSVVRALMTHDIPAAQLAGAAYGSHRPRATNLTRPGRQVNRRVEIALFRDFPYLGADTLDVSTPVQGVLPGVAR